MVKVKNKKKVTADNLRKKKDSGVKKLNPFEIHINKQKFHVLGQQRKHDRGLPGVSRAKALQKRQKTLLPEFNSQNKSNQFVDRRIGAKNKTMTVDEQITARFAAERIKMHNKKTMYNLGDEEVITHRGQTLSEIEKFDDPRSDDDYSDNERGESGRLNAEFVDEAHFGGGMLSKGKTGKSVIEQLIAESKRKVAEKQKIREETIELTNKLDNEWKDLLPIVNLNKKSSEDQDTDTRNKDDYDKVMRELKFESRGNPTDRLKSEDEIAREEKERLEKLEQDRLNRMKGIAFSDITQPKHRSADDLDDNFVYGSDPEDKNDELSNDEKETEVNAKDIVEEKDDESDISEEESEVETASEDDLSDLKTDESDSSEEDNSLIQDEEITSTEIVKETKVEKSKDINIVNDSKTEKSKKGKMAKNIEISTKTNVENSHVDLEQKNKIKEDLLARKDIMEKAREELPYTFAIPETFEEFQETFSSKSLTHQSVIVERMIKCNHPSLAETNKEKLATLFIYLLQHINNICEDIKKDCKVCFQTLDYLAPFLFDLAHINPGHALNSVLSVLKEKQISYREQRKNYPELDTLIYFKIISFLFPTSDFRHQVVTPALVFLSQILTNCRVKTKRDIAAGLFLSTLCLEYTALSKRFPSAVINFLRGLVYSAIQKSILRTIPVIPPFKTTNSLLFLSAKYKEKNIDFMMNHSDLIQTPIDDNFRIRSIYICLKLISEFYSNLSNLESSWEIFQPIYNLLPYLPFENYPPEIQNEINKLTDTLSDAEKNRKLSHLVLEKEKPKALRLYEPNIQQVTENRKRKSLSADKAEREKLIYKLKKETKGAMREIRRDNAFLAKLKFKKIAESDAERRQKVKQILSGASAQQGELNALERKRKKK